ncbi:chaperone protein DnaJ [Alphaproteobacteria bacterium]|nr:chaperone protein DnaJ [Alphaproteobacteria bacterium]
MSRDYYETLGVSKASSDADIKKAYRTLAMKYHPDRNKGDKGAEAKFKEINEAYETLKDPQKKAAYDRYGHENYSNAANGGGFNNRGFSSNDFDFGTNSPFSDIFEEFFGNSSSMRSERMDMRGADLRYETSITLEEAFRGKNIDLKIKTNVGCKACGDTGSEGGAKPKICPSCRGSGKMRFSQGFFMVERTCAACNGTGHIIENSCRECRGAGRVGTTKNISVSIPAGIEDGARIRLSGEGEAGIRGGRSGDLYIFVTVKPHRLFRREGSTIHCDVPVSMITAALGGDIEVPTIDGKKAVVKMPAGTQSGNILKLRNKGMTVIRSTTRGDMMIHAKVETPVNLTKRQKELLGEFDSENNSHPQSSGFFSKVKEFWQQGFFLCVQRSC